jgi:4-amino-4-deoxy-L-arabinose transferase-like glycosyltransferase
MIRHLRTHSWLYVPLLLGILVRVLYILGTPPDLRQHDVGGHVEYIEYMARHWRIPPAHDGFEFYHPPLYYLTATPIFFLKEWISLEPRTYEILLQWHAALLSVLTLLFGLLCGPMILHRKEQKVSLLLYGLGLATLPGLVFMAGRINNDALAQLIAFAAFWMLLRWWRGRAWTAWFGVCALLGMGLLTKTSTAPLIPVAFLALLMRPHLAMRPKIINGIIGLALIVSLGGWFHIARYSAEENSRAAIVGNVDILTNVVENRPSYLTVFSPKGILQHPYNHAFEDSERRQYFWEFFYRSAFFGEFILGPERRALAQGMLGAGMILLLLGAASLWRELRLRWRETAPMWLTLAFLAAGHFAFRIALPFSSSQDFRYSPLLATAFIYYACISHEAKGGLLQMARYALTSFLWIASVAMIVSLWAEPVA